MKEGPTLLRSDETGGEDDCVERYIIFSHELEQFHIFVDPPILIVFLEEVSCNGDVTDRCIEPYIKNFFLELFHWNSYTPFQVTSNALGLESHTGPSLGYSNRVLRPISFLWSCVNPFFKLMLNLRKINEEMNRLSHFRCLFADMTEIVLQFSGGIEGLLAFVTLVSASIRELTKRTCSDNETISQP